jgi:hypothetical protein
MTVREAIAELNSLRNHPDPEYAHGQADEILLLMVDPAVRETYEQMVETQRWWAGA